MASEWTKFWVGLVILAIALSGSGCSKSADPKCGEGTVLRDGVCVAAAGATKSTAPPVEPAAEAKPKPKPAEPAQPAKPTVVVAMPGQTVQLENSEWVVVGAEWKGRRLPSNNQFQEALQVEDGKLLVVQYKVRNLLKDKVEVKAPKIYDSTGRSFEPVEGTAFYVPRGKKTPNFMETAPPGTLREFWGAYHVADDSTDLVMAAHDIGGGTQMKPIFIGLK